MKLTENDLDRYLERDPGGDDYIFDITDYAPRTRELIRLARLGLESEKYKKALAELVWAINWDEQNASCYSVGEDAADIALHILGFNFDEGICNDSIEKFIIKLLK